MQRNPLPLLLTTALASGLALAGCKKQEDTVTPPPAIETPTPEAPPAQTPAPTAAASVTGIELGSAVDPASHKVTAATTQFKPGDKIHVSVVTATSDPAASVPGKLGARWSFQDGQVVNDESRDITFSGDGVTAFSISKPDGWPVGKYKVEITLDGAVVQSREFEVKQ